MLSSRHLRDKWTDMFVNNAAAQHRESKGLILATGRWLDAERPWQWSVQRGAWRRGAQAG